MLRTIDILDLPLSSDDAQTNGFQRRVFRFGHAYDENACAGLDYDEVHRHFEDQELVDLTTLTGQINLERLAIGFWYEHPVE
jgi:hypothetical protein